MRKINFKKIGLAVALLMSAFTFQSCDSDDDTNWDQVRSEERRVGKEC